MDPVGVLRRLLSEGRAAWYGPPPRHAHDILTVVAVVVGVAGFIAAGLHELASDPGELPMSIRPILACLTVAVLTVASCSSATVRDVETA